MSNGAKDKRGAHLRVRDTTKERLVKLSLGQESFDAALTRLLDERERLLIKFGAQGLDREGGGEHV